MIEVTKLNGSPIVINADLIETVEPTPDTIITITTGKKIVVLEKVEDIIKKTIDYKRSIFHVYKNNE